MAIQLQLRRGTETENTFFTGAVGEVSVDTTIYTLKVHDGVTRGGHELAKASLSNALITKSLTPKLTDQIDVGTVANRWRNLYLSNFIRLGTTFIKPNPTDGGIILEDSLGTYGINQGLKKTDSPIFENLTVNGIIYGSVESALKLKTPRTISITGDITYTSEEFDGTKNVTGVGTLASINSTVGTFGGSGKLPVVTVNEKGLVTKVEEEEFTGGGTDLPDRLEPGIVGSSTKVPVISYNAKGIIVGVSEEDVAGGALPDIIVAGTKGSSTKVPIITYNEKGLITAISEQDALMTLPIMLDDSGIIGSSSKIPVISYNESGIITDIQSVRADFSVVENALERNAIVDKRIGMVVLTKDTNRLWQWTDALVWKEYVTKPGKETITKNISEIRAFDYVDFTLGIGNSVIAYSVLVSHPCVFEVFERSDRTDTNPYKFVATEDHLIDDGSTLMSDGTVLRGRRYHIWSSFDGDNKIHCRVSNSEDAPITTFALTVIYSSIEGYTI